MNKRDKYAVGDRVKLIGPSYLGLAEGEECTVVDMQDGIFYGDIYTCVRTDRDTIVSGYDWRFEKV